MTNEDKKEIAEMIASIIAANNRVLLEAIDVKLANNNRMLLDAFNNTLDTKFAENNKMIIDAVDASITRRIETTVMPRIHVLEQKMSR